MKKVGLSILLGAFVLISSAQDVLTIASYQCGYSLCFG